MGLTKHWKQMKESGSLIRNQQKFLNAKQEKNAE